MVWYGTVHPLLAINLCASSITLRLYWNARTLPPYIKQIVVCNIQH
ncbi:hypothetical protein AMD24_00710 [Candidatus Xiphinematobacter sp. Idaho Grape]|nr:hypothetical protein AMD24_00710 [Candidatus Xiphinematobacter sp. Idaho Grape]